MKDGLATHSHVGRDEEGEGGWKNNNSIIMIWPIYLIIVCIRMRIEQPHPLLSLVDDRTLAQVLLSSFPNKKSIA